METFSSAMRRWMRGGMTASQAMRGAWADVRAGRVAPPPKRAASRVALAVRGGAKNPARARRNPIYDVYWSPEGRKIATVDARTPRSAKRKAPAPYRRYPGEMYTVEVGPSPPRPKRARRNPITYSGVPGIGVGPLINPRHATPIYGRVLTITARKTEGPHRGKSFVHRFGAQAKAYGMPNGDVLLTARRLL